MRYNFIAFLCPSADRTTIIAFLMVVLNNAQSRDTGAINAKLDALIVAIERADNRLVKLERLPMTEAETITQEVNQIRVAADNVEKMVKG